jgi:competence protein ComEC
MERTPAGSKISKTEWLVSGALFAGTVLSFVAVGVSAHSDNLLRVWFLDVGQGDSEFIESPNGNQILIDGGPDSKVIGELGKIMPFFDHSIDMLILTHPHDDHVSGLIDVLNRYDVGQIVENEIPYDGAAYKEWNKLKTEAAVTQAESGQVIDIGGGAAITILYPDQSGTDKPKVTTPHDYMVVARLDYGGESLLLTGDMEEKIERRLVYQKANLDSDFLKVGHHGSKTSTSEAFLQAVTPIVAFIEVGAKNRFGHPSPLVLDRLEKSSIKYYRSDMDGTVELELDGENYKIIKK